MGKGTVEIVEILRDSLELTPTGRIKKTRPVSILDFYHKDLGVSRKEYNEINKRFLQFVMNLVLDGHKVNLPLRMGSLEVVGKKQKLRKQPMKNGKLYNGYAIDWKATKEYNKAHPDAKKFIYHLNTDQDGFRYKIKWGKSYVFHRHKESYGFIAARTFKREVARRIKSNEVQYPINND